MIGIISANAFDKKLENSSGISDKDFILKPLNWLELINWIGDRLSLEWIEPEQVAEISVSSSTDDYPLPSKDILNQLIEMIDMGYVVGVRKLITELDEQDVDYEQFIINIRRMADNFELESMKIFIEEKISNAW